MTFDKAFERLTKMAGERRCSLRYSRRQSGEFGIMSESVCSIGEGDDFIITRDHGTFDGALVEMAALLADYQDAPEIEG
ncbi:MAG: hypothetical protein Q8P56_01540 [Candidatus Uhrbacteria bacterium]|nr:hypothetical protein [Candidatus Uhrbacteria bacterium]